MKLLYRQLLKEARKIPNENVKFFVIRKVKERNGDLKEAEEAINVLKRYSLISKLYWSNYYTNVLSVNKEVKK
jgi:hypothetical protein